MTAVTLERHEWRQQHTGRERSSRLHRGSTRRQLAKVRTGIVGLDDVLRGGLPAGRMTLVSGGAGSGKSLIAMQCALHGATVGEPSILVLFEERAARRTSKRAEPGVGRAGARAEQEVVPP